MIQRYTFGVLKPDRDSERGEFVKYDDHKRTIDEAIKDRGELVASKAILDELRELLDCVQSDGTISGVDEIHPQTTLGQVLHSLLQR